jgi:quercetin dioxygenase-like cupin family protein
MTMRHFSSVIAVAVLMPLTLASQTGGPSVPLGAGRPETEGITRTTLKDDPKATVTRVRLNPNAAEPPHTHPADVVLVPVTAGTIELVIGDRKITSVQPGEVQFVARDVVHSLKNTGKLPFELIAIAVK